MIYDRIHTIFSSQKSLLKGGISLKKSMFDKLYFIQQMFIRRISTFDDDMYYQMFCYLALCHTGINILVMSFLKVYPPLIINIIGFVLCVFAGIAGDKKNTTAIHFIVLTYGIASLIGSAYCLDERLGFQNYLFTLIPISLVLAHSKVQDNNRTFHIASATLFVVFLSRFLFLRINHSVLPCNIVSEQASTVIELINSFEIMVMLFLCVFVFSLRFDLINKELSKANLQLDKAANTDSLTGLYNRRFLHETFGSATNKPEEFHVLICDIDLFKKINDTYGHVVGDSILEKTANILKESISDSDYAVRWGGEEFMLIVFGRSNNEITALATELLLKVKSTNFNFEETTIHITITIGIAHNEPNADYESTIKKADDRLLLGKAQGKDIFVFEA